MLEKSDNVKGLRFKLSGKTACFRRAEFNSYAYFTYNNIHKLALLGLLGAVVGYRGYNQQRKEEMYPEYYEKLKHLKVSIVPECKNYGVFPKKIQVFNNSVGYASAEDGGNLVVREQWIENPCWYIYILDDGSVEYTTIEKYVMEGKTKYIPYLGKNDHLAVLSEAEVVDLEKTDSRYIDSLVVMDSIKYIEECDDEDEDEFVVKENVPVSMDSVYNFAVYSKSVYTNYMYDRENIENVYSDGKRNLFFF